MAFTIPAKACIGYQLLLKTIHKLPFIINKQS